MERKEPKRCFLRGCVSNKEEEEEAIHSMKEERNLSKKRTRDCVTHAREKEEIDNDDLFPCVPCTQKQEKSITSMFNQSCVQESFFRQSIGVASSHTQKRILLFLLITNSPLNFSYIYALEEYGTEMTINKQTETLFRIVVQL